MNGRAVYPLATNAPPQLNFNAPLPKQGPSHITQLSVISNYIIEITGISRSGRHSFPETTSETRLVGCLSY